MKLKDSKLHFKHTLYILAEQLKSQENLCKLLCNTLVIGTLLIVLAKILRTFIDIIYVLNQ